MNAAPTLHPRRFPVSTRSFVDREHELELVQSKLDVGVRGEPMPSNVVCFWATYGLGKSWLLLELERRHRAARPPAADSHSTIAARVDLTRESFSSVWQDSRLNREQLIKELWEQLASQLGGELPDLEGANEDRWVRDFVQQVNNWSAASTPLIMLDAVDELLSLDERAFAWLEKHLIERLALTDQVLFVFASRGELRGWSDWQVRRRIDSHRLQAFDCETAGREVGAGPAVSEELYRHAFGHPLVTECLGTWLEDQRISLRSNPEREPLVDPAVARQLLTEVIGEILEGLPRLPADMIRHACVLRWVNVEPLRFLAEELNLADRGRGDALYLDLIQSLQAHYLLYWTRVGGHYECDPTLRRLLAHTLELAEPSRFCEAHLAAYNFHHQQLALYPNYLAQHVPELAYHRAILERVGALEPQLQSFQEWWEAFLARADSPTSPDSWAELAEAIDQDTELREQSGESYARLRCEAQQRTDL